MKKTVLFGTLFLSSGLALLLNTNEVYGESPIYNPLDPTEVVTPIEGTQDTQVEESSTDVSTTEASTTTSSVEKVANQPKKKAGIKKKHASKEKKEERIWLDDLLTDNNGNMLPSVSGGGEPVLSPDVLAKIAAKLSGKVLIGSVSQKNERFIL